MIMFGLRVRIALKWRMILPGQRAIILQSPTPRALRHERSTARSASRLRHTIAAIKPSLELRTAAADGEAGGAADTFRSGEAGGEATEGISADC